MSTPTWNKLLSSYTYDETVTKDTEVVRIYSQSLLPFNELCKKEGCKEKVSSTVLVAYMDLVAEKENPEKPPKSMDFMHGVRLRSANDIRGQKLLLSECRFNYSNLRNLKKSELEEKIKNTKSLLGEDVSKIYSSVVFLFKESEVQQAVNLLYRFKPDLSWIALTAKEYEKLLS